MTTGRTSWWARDAALHDRELVVELGDEFGAAGPYLHTVLCDVAQQQREDGGVKTGYRSIARKAFCSPDEARAIVERAAEIGLLDDFEPDPDGRRFTCRISGWQADQRRGKEALKKVDQRSAPLSPEEGTSPLEEGPVPNLSPLARACVDQTIPNKELLSESERLVTFDRKPVPGPRLQLAESILTEFNAQAGTGYGAFTARGKPSEELRRIIGALTDAVPPLEFEEAQRMIRVALADPKPFWSGRPHAGVVFGPGVVARWREQSKRSVPQREGDETQAWLRSVNGGEQAA